MGRARSLSADEILAQLFLARRVCRRAGNDDESTSRSILPRVDNVVFMGMGESADNADAVVAATTAMVDANCFGLAPSRVTNEACRWTWSWERGRGTRAADPTTRSRACT